MREKDTAEKAKERHRLMKTSMNVRNMMLSEEKCATLFIKSKNNENSAVKYEANSIKRNTKFWRVVMCGRAREGDGRSTEMDVSY